MTVSPTTKQVIAELFALAHANGWEDAAEVLQRFKDAADEEECSHDWGTIAAPCPRPESNCAVLHAQRGCRHCGIAYNEFEERKIQNA